MVEINIDSFFLLEVIKTLSDYKLRNIKKEYGMKIRILNIIILMVFAAHTSAGTVRIHNNDSRTHLVKLKCNGSSKNLQVSGSSTSSYTFHSTASSCDIIGGTVNFSVSRLKDGQSWKFKDNKANSN